MQNWDAMQPTANYDQHNSWYNSMFAANIKTEPGLSSPPTQVTPTTVGTTSQLENYLKQQHQHHHHQQQQQQQLQMTPMDTLSTAMTPSPSNNESMQHFFDSNMQQQLLQQQQYQQQFQQAQHAAAQNQLSSSAHLPLGFNPLTPPGLPTAVLPTMTHFYNNMRPGQQTPSPQPTQQTAAQSSHLQTTPLDGSDKLQSALTPRNTPPMEVTPPKSPKAMIVTDNELDKSQLEKDQDLISNSSEDIKYMAESEDDETIRMPIYNSHGKMKNYKCKTCGMVAITKVAFWEHARAHMKPEKILQCPKCPFVTELKHHLEYHIRKHKNLKPFQCDKCSYSCVNKSMLNSHRKSHSSVYQYRCSDCDYATKYCHSFKLHLRKYDHKPGMVLDEQGIPNPSVVIDVYGTRRGPKTKSVSGGNKRNGERLTTNNLSKQTSGSNNGDMKLSTSQLSAALQGFHQMPASPAKSTSSTTSELPTLTLNMTLQQQHQQHQQQQLQQQHQQQQQQQQQKSQAQANSQQAQQTMSNLLPPLANLLQQNHNMAFFPYWNLNLQMLAAQQQAAVLAQLSPRMRETALQHLQNQHAEKDGNDSSHEDEDDDDEVEEADDEDCDRKSIDSAMDLSQGTPTKEENQANTTNEVAMNLKLQDETTNDTPIISSISSSRRKGRVLKLDSQLKSASQSPEVMPVAVTEMPTASSPISTAMPTAKIQDEHSSSDESMENITGTGAPTVAAATAATTAANTSASSTASSSGNSSNSSSSSTGPNSAARGGAIYECKYCDIYFKDAVLYTIHMGYHSCDDVFKCNMCGEKCDGPVGLFVHMARNAHS